MEPLGKRKPYKEGKARESPREDIHAEGKREIGYARDGEGKERVYGYGESLGGEMVHFYQLSMQSLHKV